MQLTHIIAEKEKKSSSYREGRLDALSEEKTLKIKKFAKEYIAKILRKLDKKRRESGGGSGPAPAASTSTSTSTPTETEASLAATVADVMDLDGPDDGDDDGDVDGDRDVDMDGADLQQTPEHASPLPDSETPTSDSLGTPSSAAGAVVSDPRLRHRKEECGWDPDAEKMVAGRVRPVVVSAVSVS